MQKDCSRADKRRLVITIDGPSGAGKSTVSRLIAEKMSYLYLDTGALYRAVAYQVVQAGLGAEQKKQICALCSRIKITLAKSDRGMRIVVDGEEITEKIRTEQIGLLASTDG